MIRTVIIDDEKDARFLLRNQLETHFHNELEILGEAFSVESALEVIQEHSPEIVFLDINMPDGSGFDLLMELGEYSFDIIFVTAYDEYALKAFEFSALGYLTKPIHSDSLKTTVSYYIRRKNRERISHEDQLKILIENHTGQSPMKKLVLPNNKGFEVCEINDIVRIESDRNYSNFYLQNNEKFVSSKTLGLYETLLSSYGFFRIHQSTLINMRFVKNYKKHQGGTVELVDGSVHKISRYRKNDFLQKFLY
ncbi:MAG: response regulator transcription factor [Flavobacteriales bacterium]|nr:response regulator transcription factor [Flavobacteriales bacterium]